MGSFLFLQAIDCKTKTIQIGSNSFGIGGSPV